MAFIFVASTGRCGTKFLTAVWKYFTKYPSFHEPVPYCAGQTLREVNNECGMNKSSREELRTKLLQISGDAKEGNYFESNQMFIKSYLHLVVYKKEFRPLYVIYLHRNPIEVTMSYFKKTFPSHDMSWHLQPQWQKNLMRGRKGLGFHEISLWQCFEIRERFLLWKDKFDKTYDFDFRKISDPEEYRKMFAHFEIEHELPQKFPDNFFHPRKTMNAIQEDPAITFKRIIEDWGARGQDPTKSAQDHFFESKEQQIRELQQKKGEKNNEA